MTPVPSKARLAMRLGAMLVALGLATTTHAQDNSDLAKQLANPVAALISVPFQLNWDQDIGPQEEGSRFTLNVQPVVPISFNEDWNLISRTILPVISQDDIFAGKGSQFGLGDTVQSLFFSPKAPTAGGWILGVGPAFLLPTATDRLLGAEKWGAGPTGVALRQAGPWTYGALFNHVWSFAGDGKRNDISGTFLQPFVSYTTPTAWTFALNTESTYNWKGSDWSVPVNLMANKVIKVGDQLMSAGGGLRYYAESADNGPEGLGARLVLTLLFPK